MRPKRQPSLVSTHVAIKQKILTTCGQQRRLPPVNRVRNSEQNQHAAECTIWNGCRNDCLEIFRNSAHFWIYRMKWLDSRRLRNSPQISSVLNLIHQITIELTTEKFYSRDRQGTRWYCLVFWQKVRVSARGYGLGGYMCHIYMYILCMYIPKK